MKLVDDIFSSIVGSAKTRVSDPFIGTFVCSWVVCNWNYLALLAWGEGNATERVSAFYIYLTQTPIFGWNSLFVFPFLIALFYLFVFPWLSFVVKFMQRQVNDKLHQQAVDIELIKVSQQEKLNMAKLKADPDKQFLEQLVQHDIDRKNEILEHIRQRTVRFAAKANEALSREKEQDAKAKEAENNTQISKLELDKKVKQFELDKVRFESNSAKARATLASHRFPSAYFLMSQVEGSLRQDGVQLSLKASGEIIAVLFGYESFEELLSDENFCNDSLAEVKYVYYDSELAKGLEKIVLDERSENENLSANLIFDHLQMLFEGEPFELVTSDLLEEYSRDKVENSQYELLNGDGVSGAIAESDTIFEYIDDIHVDSSTFDNGFSSKIIASASGEHRRESGIPGRTMTISLEMKSNVIVGKYGLGAIEEGQVIGSLDDFD
ncbi:cell envelope integrity protein TolA [Vibrio cholerae]|uniref:cell envelope integrity protein TolA n=1 Tax=Vibrio cholerae TaxID=666 RepID=UPI00115B797C|nr:cell envelope integrity protein TolA [Vibrio cholerae]TQP69333.1 cell envelope integrity protein TolA [Vibrio cholerae]HDZ9534045.1 cell envelope integrity protein TolA [Vibrio cholerae]